MRYALLTGALAFALCSGICDAEELKDENASESGAITQQGSGGVVAPTAIKHFDSEDDIDEPVERIGVMNPGESYDENTGLPDVVESDSSMEL